MWKDDEKRIERLAKKAREKSLHETPKPSTKKITYVDLAGERDRPVDDLTANQLFNIMKKKPFST